MTERISDEWPRCPHCEEPARQVISVFMTGGYLAIFPCHDWTVSLPNRPRHMHYE